jgi:hypothetical protein
MKTTNPRITPIAMKEMSHRFENDVARADAVRASALTGLQRLRAARANHIQRERERLARDLGDEHPDVLRLKAEWTSDQRFVRNLGVQIDRAQAMPPTVDGREWILHGYVRNQDLEGQTNLTLALFDRSGRWIEGLGHTCTDARGYFQLRYQESTAGKSDPVVATRSGLFIRVSDQKQKILYHDKRPMTVELGQVEYREIVLNVTDTPCAPPSAGKSARPPAASSSPDSPSNPSKSSSRRKSRPRTKPS